MTILSEHRSRHDEVRFRLSQARDEVDAACRRAGRAPEDVDIIAVTKHFPAADVCLLAELGIVDIGENRDQEAAGKAAEVAAAGVEVNWHFVGQLQRNKARSVVRYASVVHSIDRRSLVTALDKAAQAERDAPLDVCLQLSVDEVAGRGGVAAGDDESLAEAVLRTRGLRLRGVMAVAPVDMEPVAAFSQVARRAERLRRIAPDATVISAGMSGDFAAAIECGASMIRLGSKLLGPRDNLR